MNKAQSSMLITLNTIGEAVLVEAFKEAAYYLNHTNGNGLSRTNLEQMSNGEASYAFLKGTGLEMAIEYYHLDYRAYDLRRSFMEMMRWKNWSV